MGLFDDSSSDSDDSIDLDEIEEKKKKEEEDQKLNFVRESKNITFRNCSRNYVG